MKGSERDMLEDVLKMDPMSGCMRTFGIDGRAGGPLLSRIEK
jgi:hypothetical protein